MKKFKAATKIPCLPHHSDAPLTGYPKVKGTSSTSRVPLNSRPGNKMMAKGKSIVSPAMGAPKPFKKK
jgi:hypothetical protein